MKVDDYEIPEELYYTKEHEWLKVNGSICTVGITDYAQKTLHEVVFVDLPKLGREVSQMESFGTVESVKAVSDVFSPITGKIVERNEKLSDTPELVNQDPYGAGWIVKIEPKNLRDDLGKLLDAKAYSDFIKELKSKK